MPEATLAALLLPPNRSALESAVVQALHTRTHPERTIVKRAINQLNHFGLTRRICFKGERRGGKLQNRHVDPDPILWDIVENVI